MRMRRTCRGQPAKHDKIAISGLFSPFFVQFFSINYTHPLALEFTPTRHIELTSSAMRHVPESSELPGQQLDQHGRVLSPSVDSRLTPRL